MLAELGRRGGDRRRRARKLQRLIDDAKFSELRALHLHRRLDVPHLRIGEHLVDGVDRPAGHFRGGEDFDPLGGRAGRERLVDLRIQRGAVLRAVDLALEIFALEEVLAPDALADAPPHRFPGRGDIHVAVFRLVRRGRHAGRMIVSRLARDLALHQVARRLEVEQRDLRHEERGLHPLPLARHFALEERGHDSQRREQARRDVGDRHEPAHALRDLVESRPVAIGPVLAEPGYAREHDTGVRFFQRLVIDAQANLHVGPVVLDHDVGGLRELHEDLHAFSVLEVERDRALVAMQVLEVRAFSRSAHRGLQPRRRLDLDHVRAEVGELAHAGRPGAHAREIKNAETRKSSRSRHVGHGGRRDCRSM